MRILLVHNAYQHRGGEDSVFEAEATLLREHGDVVEMFVRHNDSINGASKLGVAAQTFWSRSSAREFKEKLWTFCPDVVHVHNTFPLISPSVYWAAKQFQVPVVQTLHNFRLHCPQAMYLRNSIVCEDCLGRIPWRGAVRGCYRGSVAQSSVLAGMVTVHRALGTWQKTVTRYVALNEFCRNKFIEGGLPAERIVIKPNFVDFDLPARRVRSGFLFVGRLSAEKGVATLARASSELPEVYFRVAGSGPEEESLQGVPNVLRLGALSGPQVREEMSRSVALVLPSICYEGFPRTLAEALGCGLPVIASRIGALAELVEDNVTGLLFEPGNAADLAEKIRWAQDHPDAMAAMGENARACYEQNYTAERNYQQLMAIYRDAIDEVGM